ncbi:MAG: PQQ-binding-like beta-propeller repeat protein [Gammaproteobacteria bacterium]|nr:PQQ-binding-like beta-propeller repeat protein [Gammaproteobacteria bacterium]MDP2140771.1 PQQ-binding-like beta-propeller repeat protein [Gammaproteobacteria bacterium]MDP2347025.1 PQQ-binding-like beta-propeller repeat protein [Gammaproteobacteria bacterium]
MKKAIKIVSRFVVTAGALACVPLALGQTGTSVDRGDWPVYHGNEFSQRYSPLDQINAQNVGSLQIAWNFSTQNFGPDTDFTNPSTPLEIDGVLYANIATTRNVVALDATSGEVLWMWRPQEGERFERAPRKGAGRGVAYYRNGDKTRIIDVTPGYHLVSLDAKTGIPDPSFGNNGIVDLMVGLRNAVDDRYPNIDIGMSAPPFVMNDVIVVGAAHATGGRPRSKINVKGDVRGFDVHTGELLWTFHTIPEAGEVGFESWLENSAEYTGNTGVWAPISGDPDLGMVYLPVEDPTGDYYGGDRPGSNLFSSSIVALDVRTGERRWHYQLIHHDIWDWDVPAAPVLADLPNGRKVIMSVTKQAFVYTFDRETGEPIWPIEERPVPGGDVPGEWYSLTQPFPTRPAAFDRQGFTEEDLIDFTPQLRALALESIQGFRLSPSLYSPPSLAEAPDGTRGLLSLPSSTGGANWEGSALDPETGILYVPSRTTLQLLSLAKNPASDIDFSQGTAFRVPRVEGLDIVKPPYGRVTAIDMNSGEHLWWVANAGTPDRIANHPLLAGVDLPDTGVPTRSGILLTKTLLFVAEGIGTADAGPKMRVINKETGEVLMTMDLPDNQTGLPFTYEHNGKQYLALFVGGRTNPAQLVAYTLP